MLRQRIRDHIGTLWTPHVGESVIDPTTKKVVQTVHAQGARHDQLSTRTSTSQMAAGLRRRRLRPEAAPRTTRSRDSRSRSRARPVPRRCRRQRARRRCSRRTSRPTTRSTRSSRSSSRAGTARRSRRRSCARSSRRSTTCPPTPIPTATHDGQGLMATIAPPAGRRRARRRERVRAHRPRVARAPDRDQRARAVDDLRRVGPRDRRSAGCRGSTTSSARAWRS